MILQTGVWLITLYTMGIVIFALAYVFAKSGKPAESAPIQQKASAIRLW